MDDEIWRKFKEEGFRKHGSLRKLSDEVEELLRSTLTGETVLAGLEKLGTKVSGIISSEQVKALSKIGFEVDHQTRSQIFFFRRTTRSLMIRRTHMCRLAGRTLPIPSQIPRTQNLHQITNRSEDLLQNPSLQAEYPSLRLQPTKADYPFNPAQEVKYPQRTSKTEY